MEDDMKYDIRKVTALVTAGWVIIIRVFGV